MPKTIHVAHSPDSDDAFMFYALAEGKIDTGDLRTCTSCRTSRRSTSAPCAASWRSPRCRSTPTPTSGDEYALLRSASSMGDGYGPRLVATRRARRPARRARGRRVAVPGMLTTAYLALQLYQPDCRDGGDAVRPDRGRRASGRGRRRTPDPRGPAHLRRHRPPLWADLGAWWLAETGLPLPLGGNVVRRDLGAGVIAQMPAIFAPASCMAWTRAPALAHAMQFARGLGDEGPTPSSGCT